MPRRAESAPPATPMVELYGATMLSALAFTLPNLIHISHSAILVHKQVEEDEAG